jgi:hypothetical protein
MSSTPIIQVAYNQTESDDLPYYICFDNTGQYIFVGNTNSGILYQYNTFSIPIWTLTNITLNIKCYGIACYNNILYIGTNSNQTQSIIQYDIINSVVSTNEPTWGISTAGGTIINLYVTGDIIYILKSTALRFYNFTTQSGINTLLSFTSENYYLAVIANSTYIFLSSTSGIDIYNNSINSGIVFSIARTNCLGISIVGNYLYSTVSPNTTTPSKNDSKFYQYPLNNLTTTAGKVYDWSTWTSFYPCFGCYGITTFDNKMVWIVSANDGTTSNSRAIFSITTNPPSGILSSSNTLGNSSLSLSWVPNSLGGGTFVNYTINCSNNNTNNETITNTITDSNTLTTIFSNLNMSNSQFVYSIFVYNSFYPDSITNKYEYTLSNNIVGCGYYSTFNSTFYRNLMTTIQSSGTPSSDGKGFMYIGPLLINFSVGLYVGTSYTTVSFKQPFQTIYGIVLQEKTSYPPPTTGYGYVTTNSVGNTGFIPIFANIDGYYWIAWGI